MFPAQIGLIFRVGGARLGLKVRKGDVEENSLGITVLRFTLSCLIVLTEPAQENQINIQRKIHCPDIGVVVMLQIKRSVSKTTHQNGHWIRAKDKILKHHNSLQSIFGTHLNVAKINSLIMEMGTLCQSGEVTLGER